MTSREKELSRGYAAVYSRFDSSLIQKVRSEVFEEDIGQHSWLAANELREYLNWFSLSRADCIDFGCGPVYPPTYLVTTAR